MAEWFIHANGEQQGPLQAAEILAMVRDGRVQSDDLAWTEGMPSWSAVGSIAQLAGRGVPAAAAAVPVMSVGTQQLPLEDPGPFQKIGSQFNVGGKAWTGRAVASGLAFYLLKIRRLNQAGIHGGLAGALLSAALSGTDDDVRTCDLNDLPPAIRAQLDPKGKRKSGDVIIVRKESLSFVKIPRLNNAVTLRLGNEKIKLNTSLFAIGGVGRFLSANGWIVNQELTPTEAPIHGAGFGRDPSTPKKKTSLVLRILYVIIAILIFVAVVWLRTENGR
jgi:hypothetical protein